MSQMVYNLTWKSIPAIEGTYNYYSDMELSSGTYCDRYRQKTVWVKSDYILCRSLCGLRRRPVVETQGDTDFSGIYYDMDLCHSVTVLSHQLMYELLFMAPIHGSSAGTRFLQFIILLSWCILSSRTDPIHSVTPSVFHTAVSC